jgi:hypothetical protein
MKPRAVSPVRPPLDLIEEAVHLLRQLPVPTWLAYLAGTGPFVLGLLYFWADLSVSAIGARHCAGAALGLAALFLWLKCWQAVFVAGLQAQIAGRSAERWTPGRIGRLILLQGIAQPSKLIVLPLAAVVTLPFAWVFAFYEAATGQGAGGADGVRAALRRAAAQSRVWPVQNHYLLLALLLVALVVWVNTVVAAGTLPFLLKIFLGVETNFTRSGIYSWLNSTFLAATAALAWLAFDPLVKAVYALRGFYIDARQDGADLVAELKFVSARAGRRLALFAGWLLISSNALAAEIPAPLPPATETIRASELDAALRATLAQEKYLWRMPREVGETTSPERGWLEGLFQGIGETFAGWARAVRDFLRDVYSWLERYLGGAKKSRSSGGAAGEAWQTILRVGALGLLAVAAAVLGVLLYRLWRQGGWRRTPVVAAEVLAARPDLADENVTAAQLPEDEWLALAREMAERGDLRLALRALYFAGLAHLAQRELVTLARFKSNRDYEGEVGRRARTRMELRAAFAANVSAFERAWYGWHEVTPEALQDYRANLERLRSC